MKNKSTRHKQTNTFKFQPFSERISNVDVDIFHRVGHEYEEDSDESTSDFNKTLQKWTVLNLTLNFASFRKEVAHVITLPQLLYHKQHVCDTLLKYLKLKDPLCLQALLELATAFAKDLRKEFFPYYPLLLNQLIDILHIDDPDILEWTFQCLAYFFKFLWRYFIKDISYVLNSLLPLLTKSKRDYIENFAAESFAFVARKVKDKDNFLTTIVETVEQHPQVLSGCGCLLFEIVKGVSNQFHSCAEEILPFYFMSLAHQSLSKNIIFNILQQVVDNCLQIISLKNISQFWTSILNVLEKFMLSSKLGPGEKRHIQIELLLRLIEQGIKYKEGRKVTSTEIIVNRLCTLLEMEISHEIFIMISQISGHLLLCENIVLTQENASRLTIKVLNIKDRNIVLDFIQNVIPSKSFEALILPTFLDDCVSSKLDNRSLNILTNIVSDKAPICKDGTMLSAWKQYPIDFSISKQISMQFDFSEKIFSILQPQNLENDYNEVCCTLICISHIKHIDEEKVSKIILILIENICEQIINEKQVEKAIFALFLCINVLVHVSRKDLINNLIEKIISITKKYYCDPNCLCALRVIDLALSACSTTLFTDDLSTQLYTSLMTNLSSEFHEVRFLTTHIFTLFEQSNGSDIITTTESTKLFSVCFNIEAIFPELLTYRTQVQYLSQIRFDRLQIEFYKNIPIQEFILRYLLGVLYINLQHLWEPVVNIISTYANGMPVDNFWNIFYEQLKLSIQCVKSPPELKNICLGNNLDFLNNPYTAVQEQTNRPEYKPNYINYRLWLWKLIAESSNIIYIKNRDVSPLLLNFMTNEFLCSSGELPHTWNIKKNTTTNCDKSMNVDETDDAESTENTAEKIITPIQKRDKEIQKRTLLAYLAVFSKIQNPRNVYREPELYKLYLDLLMSKNVELQKAGLDCIMNYRHKYLLPYKDNLYSLIDEKKFKNELALFRIDSESETLQKEHRDDFIPIVLRIVYSKMITKTGMRTGGKAGGQLHRSLVIQFLAGCQEKEVILFIDMAFKLYVPQLEDNPVEMIKTIENQINLEQVISPKKLQSSINLLAVILEKFGAIDSGTLLPYLLKILICVGANINGILHQSVNIHSGNLSSLRQARTSYINTISRFFSRFENYPWTALEIDAVFDISVWPLLNKLPIEGIHSPTALLKLFICWSQNPRYFVLFTKHLSANSDYYALPYIMKLLLVPNTHISVINACMEIVERLLTLQLDETEANIALEIPILNRNDSQNTENDKIFRKLNYGSRILYPHLNDVLQFLKRKIGSKTNLRDINKRELLIFSHISDIVWDPETSSNLLKLLLPILGKKASLGSHEDRILPFVQTICNLVNNVAEPQKYVKPVAPLFGVINSVAARKLLCDFLKTISLKCTDKQSLANVASLLIELNAWDAKWIDQPDFTRRLTAFKEINKMLETKNIQSELGVVIIHNCFYTLRYENDLSLRDSSVHCLRSVSVYLIQTYVTSVQKEFIINDTLLLLIENGIKDKNERVRNESISLLGHLTRECSNAYPVLSDLEVYTNKTDLEADIFENLQHLQLHRHARALVKFCQIAKTLDKRMKPRTLTQFVLPLATQYLCCEKYLNKNTIIDGAIEVVATVCKMLPWHQYEALLRYYLDKLRHSVEYQKQLVRLVVVILDGFHFDLSRANNAPDVTINPETTPSTNTLDETKNQEDVLPEAENDLEHLLNVANENETDELALEDSIKDERKAVDKEIILAPSTAKRVIASITKGLLPQLNRAISQLTQHENSHKLNRKRTGAQREEEDLLRVPISLALVKLLQKLPPSLLNQNLPGIFMKLCTFLKSPLDSVRRATREILQKIMLALGPKYLTVLLNEIIPLMQRGFQVHVLVYTIHSVLTTLKDLYKEGDIDECLQLILQLCTADIFGVVADEKEVALITKKVSEAKSTKSYDTFHTLAQFISEKCLTDLIMPIKDVLLKSVSHKEIKKAQECLRQIALGLVDNNYLSAESLVVFAYGISSQSIPELSANSKKDTTKDEIEKLAKQQADCFIIPLAPKNRFGEVRTSVKRAANVNAHILVEFGLKLCYFILKRDKLKDADFRPYLDPFVMILLDSLKSQHVKLSTLTLQCLWWIFKIDLPSMKANVGDFANAMFAILHKYAAAGLSKGDNFDLVMATFKAMSILVREVKYFVLSIDQLKALLLYAEQDLHNHEKQATAFGLLKAIISRKLISPEMSSVMEKVATLSITSELSHVQLQARQVFHQYIMDYPLGKKLDNHITFYLSQLNYEMRHGRESALEMISSLIQSFPQNVLSQNCGVLFLTLGIRLVNDDSTECKKNVAKCIKLLITKLEQKDRDMLFDVILVWFKDRKINHRQLAPQLCGFFVTVEKLQFQSRLETLMPLLLSQFTPIDEDSDEPGRFVRITPSVPQHSLENEEDQRMQDHHLFQTFQLLLKLCSSCPNFLKQTSDIDTLALYSQSLLAHPHDWVRLGAAQFIGYVMTVLDCDRIYELLISNQNEIGYLSNNPSVAIKSLTLDLCAQLYVGNVNKAMIEQVVKNLVFIARILRRLPITNASKSMNLLWLIRRLRRKVNEEVAQSPSVFILREAVFKWISAVSQIVDTNSLLQLLDRFMAPLVRELDAADKSVLHLAKHICNELKNRVGVDLYMETLSKLQMQLSCRRAQRKRERAQMTITHPELAAKRKIKLQEKKKLNSKRKIADLKGNKYKKKRKTVDLEDM